MHTSPWRQLAIQCAADPAATVAVPLLAATYVCFFHELSGRAKLDTSENVLIEETRNMSTAMLVAFRQNAEWCRSLEHYQAALGSVMGGGYRRAIRVCPPSAAAVLLPASEDQLPDGFDFVHFAMANELTLAAATLLAASLACLRDPVAPVPLLSPANVEVRDALAFYAGCFFGVGDWNSATHAIAREWGVEAIRSVAGLSHAALVHATEDGGALPPVPEFDSTTEAAVFAERVGTVLAQQIGFDLPDMLAAAAARDEDLAMVGEALRRAPGPDQYVN